MRQSAIYQRFREAVKTLGHDAAAVERLSAETVRLMAEAGAEEATATFVENMKKRLALELRGKTRQAATAWIEGQVRQRFALATVRMPEDKIAVIYLDGLDEEGV
jgi:hypothetical protein